MSIQAWHFVNGALRDGSPRVFLAIPMIYGIRTPLGGSLALQSLAYRALGHDGQDENAPLDTIPASVRSVAESLTGWPIRRGE